MATVEEMQTARKAFNNLKFIVDDTYAVNKEYAAAFNVNKDAKQYKESKGIETTKSPSYSESNTRVDIDFSKNSSLILPEDLNKTEDKQEKFLEDYKILAKTPAFIEMLDERLIKNIDKVYQTLYGNKVAYEQGKPYKSLYDIQLEYPILQKHQKQINNFNETAKKVQPIFNLLKNFADKADDTFNVADNVIIKDRENTKKNVFSTLHTDLATLWAECQSTMVDIGKSKEEKAKALFNFQRETDGNLEDALKSLGTHRNEAKAMFKLIAEVVTTVVSAGLAQIGWAAYRKYTTGAYLRENNNIFTAGFWRDALAPNSVVQAKNAVQNIKAAVDNSAAELKLDEKPTNFSPN